MVSLKLRPAYPQENSPQYTLEMRLGVSQSRSGCDGNAVIAILLRLELRSLSREARCTDCSLPAPSLAHMLSRAYGCKWAQLPIAFLLVVPELVLLNEVISKALICQDFPAQRPYKSQER
jgi:hypothetical protein